MYADKHRGAVGTNHNILHHQIIPVQDASFYRTPGNMKKDGDGRKNFVKSEGVHQALNPSAYETVDFPSRIKMNQESIVEALGESMAQKPQAFERPNFI